MRSEHRGGASAYAAGRYHLLASLVAAALVVACGQIKRDPTGAIAISIRPGETGSCDTQPCAVSLVMPPGSGSYEVTANEIRIGTFPAGQTVSLGSFYHPQAIKIKKTGVPPAYVYIPTSI